MSKLRFVLWIALIAILSSPFNTAFSITDTSKTLVTKTSNIEITEVSPVEDLMREHGVISRLLLIYAEILKRIENNLPYPPDALINSTAIIRNFVQNYHEKLEEQYIFPKVRDANKLIDLTKILEDQHKVGHKIIDGIIAEERSTNLDSKKRLAKLIQDFIYMYRPHKAREDTILFPTFHDCVSKDEYKEFGEKFEDKEQQLFGKNGFEKIVSQVETIEKSLGIYQLSKFTVSVE